MRQGPDSAVAAVAWGVQLESGPGDGERPGQLAALGPDQRIRASIFNCACLFVCYFGVAVVVAPGCERKFA